MPSRRRTAPPTALATALATPRCVAVRATVVGALVCLCASLGAASAAAEAPGALPLHARVVSSTPADGSTVDSVSEVTLEFSEEVNPDFVVVKVEGPDGNEASGTPAVRGRAVTQALTGGLAAGEHVVTFRVVSVDGHPVSGTVTFETMQLPQASASTTPSATTSSATALPTPGSPAPGTASPASGRTVAPGSTMPPWVLVALGVAVLAALSGAVLWASHRGRNDADGEAPPAGP